MKLKFFNEASVPDRGRRPDDGPAPYQVPQSGVAPNDLPPDERDRARRPDDGPAPYTEAKKELKPSQITQEQWDSGDYYLSQKSDDVPMLWDATFKIEGDTLAITGYLGPGGPGNDARATLVLQRDGLDKYYDVQYVG